MTAGLMKRSDEDRRSKTAATEIRIRDATEADLPAIVEIHNAAIASHISTAQLDPVTVGAGANGFARIRRLNIQSGSQTLTARSPAGSASGNFFRDALIAARSSSAFMSANNFGAVALAENCYRKQSCAARSWGCTHSLD